MFRRNENMYIICAYLGPGHGGNSLNRVSQTSLTTDTSFSYRYFQEDSEVLPDQTRGTVPPAYPGCSLRLLPGGTHLEHLEACSGHLKHMPSWLTSMRRANGSTLSSSQVTGVLTLSLRKWSATLRKTLISSPCIWDLVLSVYPKFMTVGA